MVFQMNEKKLQMHSVILSSNYELIVFSNEIFV